jgi:hypothetical protein
MKRRDHLRVKLPLIEAEGSGWGILGVLAVIVLVIGWGWQVLGAG